MTQRTEKAVKAQVEKLLKKLDETTPIYSLNPMTFGYGESGHPDKLVLIRGFLIGVECKKDRNNHHCRPELKPKSNEAFQKIQAEKIVKAGGIWWCVHSDNITHFTTWLTEVANGYNPPPQKIT